MNTSPLTSSKRDTTVNILKNDSMTFAEKAIGIKSNQSSQNNYRGQSSAGKLSMAGDIEVVSVDLAMVQDSDWSACNTLFK